MTLITTEDALLKFKLADSSELDTSQWVVVSKGVQLTPLEHKGGHYRIDAWVWQGSVKFTEHKTSLAMKRVIREFESLKLQTYRCPSDIPTIGFGTTRIDGRPVPIGLEITKERAEELFDEDIEDIEDAIKRALKKLGVLLSSLNENQFDALVSLCHNCGTAPLLPTNTIGKALQNGDFEAAADGFLLWNKGGSGPDKVTLPGLVRRRTTEREVFKAPID